MVKKILTLIVVCSLWNSVVQAQYGSVWRLSAGITTGGMNYMGDVQGRAGVGAPWLKDLVLSNTRPFIGLQAHYYPDPDYSPLSFRLQALWGRLTAADSLVEKASGPEMARYNRNLSFRTNICELSLALQFDLLYRERFSPLLSAGVGMVNFNPQVWTGTEYIDLQPYRTEGKAYNNIAWVFPVSLGLRYDLNDHSRIQLDLGYRFTSTDYLDDVSTVYTGNEWSYRGRLPGNYVGQQRGNSRNKDGYILAGVSLQWFIPVY